MASSNETFELSVSRFISAPPEKVWLVMTERMAQWWCPKPWQTEIVEQDWRAGGRSAMIMRGPAGEKITLEGIFLEVSSGKRFVTTDAISANWQPQGPFMIGTWEIQPEANGTRYKASARHWTAEAMKQHEQMGFHDGWTACADQLAALAEDNSFN